MSDVSCNGPPSFIDDQYLDHFSPFESTDLCSSADTPMMDEDPDVIIIEGSEYPTSNLFLSELYGIKEALDDVAFDESEYIQAMADRMKLKFDKYWGETNLLISIGAVLDPRYKRTLLRFAFKSIYPDYKVEEEVKNVEDALKEMYTEYVEAYKTSNVVSSSNKHVESECGSSKSGSKLPTSRSSKGIKSGTAKYDQHIRTVDSSSSNESSELDIYLEEGVYIGEHGVYFDALAWWKEKNLKFRILSKMAADILAIPVTTVASESAFSAGGRVIDPHRSCLGTKIVDKLICGADWYRHYYGLQNKKNKENTDFVRVELP